MSDRPTPPNSSAWRRHGPAALRDVRGGLRLALDGVQRAIDEAQAAQQRLGQVQPRPLTQRAGDPDRLSERRWPTYAWYGLRSSAQLLGGAADLTLASLQAALLSPRQQREPEPERPWRDAVVAALNGVAGDHLHRTDNPLAIPMQLRTAGLLHPRVLLLVHDLGLGAPQWRQAGHDHGQELALALGATPVYAHYNSGRAVADNGRDLAAEVQRLVAGWRVPLGGIVLLGHGLGGLVLRSALHQAQRAGMAWPGEVHKLIFLGTPLQGGASAAEPGKWLQGTALPHALARLAGHTSAGMADFASGRYLPAGMAMQEPAPQSALAPAEPWPTLAHWHAIAGSIGDGSSDGVVPLASALGQAAMAGAAAPLVLPPDNGFVVRGTDHLGLLGSRAAFERMRSWLAP